MAQLSDRQLSSTIVGAAVTHCWSIEEWNILAPVMGQDECRRWLRFLAANRDLAQAAPRAEGFAFASLAPAQQQEVRQLLAVDGLVPPYDFARARFRIEYVPAGWYVRIH